MQAAPDPSREDRPEPQGSHTEEVANGNMPGAAVAVEVLTEHGEHEPDEASQWWPGGQSQGQSLKYEPYEASQVLMEPG